MATVLRTNSAHSASAGPSGWPAGQAAAEGPVCGSWLLRLRRLAWVYQCRPPGRLDRRFRRPGSPAGRGRPAATSPATSDSFRPDDLAARRRWVNASCASRRSRSISAPLARSISPRESTATRSCWARAPVSSPWRPPRAGWPPPGQRPAGRGPQCRPGPRVDGVHVQGADRAAAQLHWDAQPRADLDLDKDQGDLPPPLLHGGVVHRRWPAAGERLRAGASGEHLLVVLQALGALVRSAGPAQPPVGVGQHDPGGVGVNQLLGRTHRLPQGGGQVLLGVLAGQGADALGEHGQVDRHEGAFSSGRRTGEPGQQARHDDGPGVPIRPYSPTKSCGLYADSFDASSGDRPADHTPHRAERIGSNRQREDMLPGPRARGREVSRCRSRKEFTG
jgi:hypothetical protein